MSNSSLLQTSIPDTPSAYGQTDEAKQAATGDVTQGKGNVHRRATRQKLEEAAKPLGHKLDLEDTYDDHKFRRPFPMAKDTSQPARRHQGYVYLTCFPNFR